MIRAIDIETGLLVETKLLVLVTVLVAPSVAVVLGKRRRLAATGELKRSVALMVPGDCRASEVCTKHLPSLSRINHIVPYF